VLYTSSSSSYIVILSLWEWYLLVWGPSWPWSYGSWIYNYLCISAYHHWCCEFKSRSGRGVQHYVIKFVSYLNFRQVCGFLLVLRFPPPIKEILLKVVLNTINQTNKQVIYWYVVL